jgi:hypothetical protein
MSCHAHDYGDSDDIYTSCILCGITRAELNCSLPCDVREFLVKVVNDSDDEFFIQTARELLERHQ